MENMNFSEERVNFGGDFGDLEVVLLHGQGGTKVAPGRHQGGTGEAIARWRVPPTKYFVLRNEVLKI